MAAHILISVAKNSERLVGAAQRADRAAQALSFERDAAELQGRFTTYILSGLEADLSGARAALASAKRRLQDFADLGAQNGLAAELDGFDRDIQELVQVRAEREKVKTTIIRAQGDIARNAVKQLLRDAIGEGLNDEALLAADALEATLLARLYVARFYDQPFETERKQVEAALTAARGSLIAPLQSAWKSVSDKAGQADAALAAYQKGFQDIVRLYGRAHQLGREIAPARGARLHDAAEKIRAEAERGAEAARRELTESFTLLIWTAAASVLAALGVGLAAAAALRGGVVRPLARMTAAMKRLAAGDLDSPTPETERRDEIGAMAAAMAVFQADLRRARALEAAQEQEQAAQLARARQIDDAARAFDDAARRTAQSLMTAVSQTRAAAAAIQQAAETTLDRSAAVADASGQASISAETVSAAASALTQIVSEVADHAQRTSAISRKAMERLRGADAAVANLSESAKNISGVVALIEGVASQTSLLALNASIEAARAGEAGRGFAVVANEVKALASQTAAATADIVHRIQQVHADADAAIDVIRSVENMVGEVDAVVDGVAVAAEEQQAAAAEIGRNAAETVESNQGVDEAIGDVSDAATRTRALSSDLAAVADALHHDAESMRDAVEGFLDAVRAA